MVSLFTVFLEKISWDFGRLDLTFKKRKSIMYVGQFALHQKRGNVLCWKFLKQQIQVH